MSSTLNGIAQGYITDKISEHLINSDINNTLVQLGEYGVLAIILMEDHGVYYYPIQNIPIV